MTRYALLTCILCFIGAGYCIVSDPFLENSKKMDTGFWLAVAGAISLGVSIGALISGT